jgi:preprotein translocase subunit SecA
MLSELLKRRGIRHNVLNAKFHEREAEIVAQAGRSGAVTIATNMAGRGTDILLGGNPDLMAAELLHQEGTNVLEATPEQVAEAQARAEASCEADREIVVGVGGLHIVGTERHEARRIDNQLRGRAGRQGDPGSSRFYLSLEDDLMRRFASDRVQGLMKTVGFTDDMALESGIVSRTIEGAQSRVEGYNFDLRKHVVQYDDVINLQRETIYEERDHILRSEDLSGTVLTLVEAEIRDLVAEFTAGDASEWNRDGLKAQLTAMIPTLGSADLEVVDQGRNAEAVADALVEVAETHYQRRADELGEPAMAGLNRIVLLRVIDGLWVEHLTAVDDMRRSIGLRAYSQRDPLNEFKVEAFRMFDELKGMIRRDVARTIFRVTVVRQPAAAAAPRMVESRPEVNGGGGGAAAMATGAAAAATAARGAGAGQPARAATKIGRNDPCYCGSGKKYKRCHGA